MIRYLFARYRKAIYAALGAGLFGLAGAYFITSPHHITDREWYAILTAVVGAAGGPVVSKPNAPADPGRHVRNERGAVDLVGVLCVVALVILILVLLGVIR